MIDLVKARASLRRLVDCAFHNVDPDTGEIARPQFRIPARDDDDDILLLDALRELEELRKRHVDSPALHRRTQAAESRALAWERAYRNESDRCELLALEVKRLEDLVASERKFPWYLRWLNA